MRLYYYNASSMSWQVLLIIFILKLFFSIVKTKKLYFNKYSYLPTKPYISIILN